MIVIYFGHQMNRKTAATVSLLFLVWARDEEDHWLTSLGNSLILRPFTVSSAAEDAGGKQKVIHSSSPLMRQQEQIQLVSLILQHCLIPGKPSVIIHVNIHLGLMLDSPQF